MNRLAALSSLALVATLFLGACGAEDGARGGGMSSSGGAAPANSSPLSAGEQQLLLFTREEEKLARDVYNAIGGGSAGIFENIAASEQTHMDVVATLLARYGLEDPAKDKAPGELTDPTLQKLYDDLSTAGRVSPLAAFTVGAEIEELDIADIERGQVGVTHADITATMDNLTRGSRNHLRSFYDQIRGLGADYTPKHIDQARFDAIVTTAKEKGGP